MKKLMKQILVIVVLMLVSLSLVGRCSGDDPYYTTKKQNSVPDNTEYHRIMKEINGDHLREHQNI